MKAGIDFGNSLVKVYRQKDGQDLGISTADIGVKELAQNLADDGVTTLVSVGIGPRDGFQRFTIIEPEGDPLVAEVTLQAKGVRRLPDAGVLPERFLLASVGTGTSYTEVDGENVVPANHIGNPMGGGFIAGMSRLFMMGEPEAVGRLAEAGTPPDTLMKHRLPALDGTPIGEFVISHFNRADVSMEEADFAAGLIHCVAVSIVRDLMVKECTDIVFIGTTVKTYSSVRAYLQRYLAMIGKNAHFPDWGQFAGAVGAYHFGERS